MRTVDVLPHINVEAGARMLDNHGKENCIHAMTGGEKATLSYHIKWQII